MPTERNLERGRGNNSFLRLEPDPNIIHFNFRPMEQGEDVGYVTLRGPGSTFWEYREQLKERPFYIRIMDDGFIWCRCPGVREELNFGDEELCRLREFSVGEAEAIIFPEEVLPELYERYRQRQGGEYKEPVAGFVWETVPDEEDKIIDEKKEKRVFFGGILGKEIPTGNNSVYLDWKSWVSLSGKVVIRFFLVGQNGHERSGGSLFTLTGNRPDGRGNKGFLTLNPDIDNRLGFDTDSQGKIKLGCF